MRKLFLISCLFILTLNANSAVTGFAQVIVCETSSDWPTNGMEGQLLYDKSDDKLYKWTGSQWTDVSGGAGGTGYTLHVQALTSSPADAQTIYFGQLPKAPVTVAGNSKIYIRKAGTIKMANIYCFSGTAGTAENWSLYIRLNNTTDTLIETLGAAASERVFDNSSLSIAVVAGDYIEIKAVNPTWATNPLTTILGGYVYVE